jgi:hypothetical protein
MCVRELEAGILWLAARVVFVADGRAVGVRKLVPLVVATRDAGAREVEVLKCFGFGVMLWSAEGSRDFFATGAGVFVVASLGRVAEASDMGGDGGSCTSETVSAVDTDFESGGVVISGELAVECGDWSNVDDSSTEISVEMAERCRDSCFLILLCRISASILRSDSSSFNL